MNNEKLQFVSILGVTSTILFIIFTLLGRTLYPFGDEPDFLVRAPSLVFSDYSWWSPYYWLGGVINQIDYTSNCNINSTPLSMFQEIDKASCAQSAWQITLRLVITLTVAAPLLFAVIFRRIFILFMKLLKYKISITEWNDRLNAVSLTLIFPGFLYFFGVLGEEQYVLLLSILMFLLWGNKYIVGLILVIIALTDIGNFLVVSYFAVTYAFLEKSSHKVKTMHILIFLVGIVIIFSVLNFYLIGLLSNIGFFAQKSSSIIDAYQGSDVINKYPIYLRPVITLMSFILFTPAYIKSPLAYAFFFPAIAFALLRYRGFFKKNRKEKNIYPESYIKIKKTTNAVFSAFFTIMSIIVILPNYSNGKYYIFLMPFFILAALKVYKKEKILRFMILINIMVFINLIFYYR